MKNLTGRAKVTIAEHITKSCQDIIVDYIDYTFDAPLVNIVFEDISNIAELKVEGKFGKYPFFEIFAFIKKVTTYEDIRNRRRVCDIIVVPYHTDKTITIFTRTLPEEEKMMENEKSMTGQITVSRLYKDSGVVTKDEIGEEQIDVPAMQPGALMGMVGYSNRYTINMGDYESAQIGVSIELPCYISKEEIIEAFQTAKTFVDQKLNQEVSEVKEYVSNRKK